MLIQIRREPEFTNWLDSQRPKERAQVLARIAKIEQEGHYGDAKVLGDGLAELRWKNGRRVYFAKSGESEITLILGGNKNGQSQDIKEARKILSR